MPIKPDIRFLLSTKDETLGVDNPLLTVSFGVVVVNEAGKIRGVPTYSRYGGERGDASELSGLVITAQLGAQDEDFYGHQVTYRELFAVDLAQAEIMVKVLRKLERSLARVEAAHGYPTDFVTYVARVAVALGATAANRFLTNTRPAQSGWSHDDMDYSYMDVNGLRSHLHATVETWKAKHGSEKA